jgi:hypothetical protein
MCGIVGALAFGSFDNEESEKARVEASIFLSTQLLQATVERGKDATGVSLLWDDGNYSGLKMGVKSPDFIGKFGSNENTFEGFVKVWRNYHAKMKVFLGHCRKSSVGNSYDNKNNHPINIGELLLIHNGTLTNHEVIFDRLSCDRDGEVDSEAIGRLLHHYTNNEADPFTKEALIETAKRLHGTYSVLAASGNNPFQAIQMRDGKPAELLLVKPLKTVFVASEKKFLENTLFELNKAVKLFGSTKGFPYLMADDVELKTMPDDSYLIWDLTRDIGAETNIEDLYEFGKTPLFANKIWGPDSTNKHKQAAGAHKTATAGYGNNKGNHYRGHKKTYTQEVNVGAKTDKSDKPAGKIWNDNLNKYKTQDAIEETTKFGHVQIDVASGEVISLDSEKVLMGSDEEQSEASIIHEASEGVVENLIDKPAVVNETVEVWASDKSAEAPNDETSSKASTIEAIRKMNARIEEAKATADSNNKNPGYVEALKYGESYVDDGMLKYENEIEVLDDLGISNAEVLMNLPLHALVNRIKKFTSKVAFVDGFIKARKMGPKETVAANGDAAAGKKKISARKKIKTLKKVMHVVTSLLEDYHVPNGQLSKKRLASIMEKIREPNKINVLTAKHINEVFTEGDIRKMPVVKDIIRNAGSDE